MCILCEERQANLLRLYISPFIRYNSIKIGKYLHFSIILQLLREISSIDSEIAVCCSLTLYGPNFFRDIT